MLLAKADLHLFIPKTFEPITF